MVIGLLHLTLSLPESRSLKDKRMILKSLKDRLHNRYNISVSEISLQDERRGARCAAAIVTTDQTHAHRVLQAVVNTISSNRRIVIREYHIEML